MRKHLRSVYVPSLFDVISSRFHSIHRAVKSLKLWILVHDLHFFQDCWNVYKERERERGSRTLEKL